MELFEKFVRNYDFTDEDISYKYKHTLRVRALCELLAKDLGLSERDIELAKYCGLYHDIARFEQDKRFDSFRDTKAFDHGDVGSAIFENLFAPNLDITAEEKNIIFKSILYHNKFAIGECTDKERIFCKILRDADKIDIIYAVSQKLIKLGNSMCEITPKIHSDFMKHTTVSYGDAQNESDEIVLKLALIWDINFDSSYRIIRDNKYFQRIEKLINNDKYKVYFDEINNFLKEK